MPRALGTTSFTIGGASGERRLLTYQAWKLQRPLDVYRSLALAPSRALELSSAERWLTRVGALDAVRQLQPRWRLERLAALPAEKEALRATRAAT